MPKCFQEIGIEHGAGARPYVVLLTRAGVTVVTVQQILHSGSIVLGVSEPVPADVLRAIAHPLRLALLVALEDHEQAPSELATALNAKEPAIAYHLAFLHDAGLVTTTTERGQWRTIEGWAEIAASLQRLQNS
jgi:DNA-binding transcriptional ArsR family regulator